MSLFVIIPSARVLLTCQRRGRWKTFILLYSQGLVTVVSTVVCSNYSSCHSDLREKDEVTVCHQLSVVGIKALTGATVKVFSPVPSNAWEERRRDELTITGKAQVPLAAVSNLPRFPTCPRPTFPPERGNRAARVVTGERCSHGVLLHFLQGCVIDEGSLASSGR